MDWSRYSSLFITALQRSGEGNVFSRVYLSIILTTGGPYTAPWLHHTGTSSVRPPPIMQAYPLALLHPSTFRDPPPPQTCSTWASLLSPFPTHYVQTCKLVRYEARTVSKWTVDIRLKCLLVESFNIRFKVL